MNLTCAFSVRIEIIVNESLELAPLLRVIVREGVTIVKGGWKWIIQKLKRKIGQILKADECYNIFCNASYLKRVWFYQQIWPWMFSQLSQIVFTSEGLWDIGNMQALLPTALFQKITPCQTDFYSWTSGALLERLSRNKPFYCFNTFAIQIGCTYY